MKIRTAFVGYPNLSLSMVSIECSNKHLQTIRFQMSLWNHTNGRIHTKMRVCYTRLTLLFGRVLYHLSVIPQVHLKSYTIYITDYLIASYSASCVDCSNNESCQCIPIKTKRIITVVGNIDLPLESIINPNVHHINLA